MDFDANDVIDFPLFFMVTLGEVAEHGCTDLAENSHPSMLGFVGVWEPAQEIVERHSTLETANTDLAEIQTESRDKNRGDCTTSC